MFGETVCDSTKEYTECRIISDNLKIGEIPMVEVELDNNKYYIPREKVVKHLKCDSLKYSYTRKDLVQVDNIVHPDLM